MTGIILIILIPAHLCILKNKIMDYTISSPQTLNHYSVSNESHSFAARLIQWATNQDAEHHVAWVGISIIASSAVFFPLTMAAVLLNGAGFGLIIVAMISLSIVVIANLAAMPTRYTIPLF